MDEQKASKDIIAEMRAKAECAKPYDDGVAMMLTDYADRFEAALKREKATIEADALAVGGIVEAALKRELSKNVSKNRADFGQLGNAAKLREALEFCVKGMCGFCRMDAEARGMTTECVNGCEALRKAKAALAEPPRNCEVGTAEEQAERFKNFCRNHQFISSDSEDGFPPVYVCSNESCPLHDYYIAHGEDNCELAWAKMPYVEKKGGAK